MLVQINNKITFKISPKEEKELQEKITNMVNSILGRYEFDYDFEDDYPLYFNGEEVKKGAFIELEVKQRKKDKDKFNELRNLIRNIYIKNLDIDEDNVFIQFYDYEN